MSRPRDGLNQRWYSRCIWTRSREEKRGAGLSPRRSERSERVSGHSVPCSGPAQSTGRYFPTLASLLRDDSSLASLLRDDSSLASLLRDDSSLAHSCGTRTLPL